MPLPRTLVHDFAEHAHGQGDFLIFVHHGDDLQERTRNPACQHVERHKRADRHRVVEHRQRAEPDDGDTHQLFEKARQRLSGRRDLVDVEANGDGPRGLIVPHFSLARLEGERLHGAHSVDGLDQQGLTFAFGLIKGLKPPLKWADQ
jgi:hypothetical protein